MNKCSSNINNDTSNVLFKAGLLSTNMSEKELNQRRSFLFYYICLPFRIFLYLSLLLFINFDYKTVNDTIQFVCLISLLHLQMKSEKSKRCQWWNNDLEQIVVLIVYIIAEICSTKKINCVPYIIPLLLFDVFSGFLQSLIKNPFQIYS